MSKLLIVGFSILACAGPAYAHHSFAAEFDADQPITVTGTVTKVEWTNPHARFYIDVQDETGTVVNWDFELRGAAQLLRLGWSRATLGPGDVVTVNGFRARTAPHVGTAREVKLADGRVLTDRASASQP